MHTENYIFMCTLIYRWVMPMAYVEIKTIGGKKYKYLRKSIRKGKKVTHATVKYIGPVEPVYKIGRRRAKSNASVYARALTAEEKEALNKSAKSNNAFTRDRAKIILLSSEKLFAKQIADKLGCEARKARAAIKSFNVHGLKALERKKAKGAEPKFTPQIRKNILENFSKEPKEFGYVFTAWTLPRLRKHLMEANVVNSISIERLRQILNASGAKLKRSKRWQYSPDRDFLKKGRR